MGRERELHAVARAHDHRGGPFGPHPTRGLVGQVELVVRTLQVGDSETAIPKVRDEARADGRLSGARGALYADHRWRHRAPKDGRKAARRGSTVDLHVAPFRNRLSLPAGSGHMT